MKKALFSILLIFLTFFNLVSSNSLEKKTINQIAIHGYDKPAEFLFNFINPEEGEYEIFTFVDVRLLPEDKFLIEKNKSEISVKVYSTSRVENIKGLYSFIFFIQYPDKKIIEDRLRINLKDISDIFEIYSDSIFPSDKISFYVENKENVSLKGIRAKFSSILFEEEKTFDILPFEKKEFSIDVNKETMKKIPAGSYLIEAKFISPNGKEYKKEGRLSIGEKKQIFSEYKKSGYVITEEKITKKNIGNVIENVQFSVEKNILYSLFISFSEKPDKIESNGLKKVYIWNKKLGPLEGTEIVVRTNLLIPLVSVLLIFGVAYLLKRYYSESLLIKKSAHPVKTKGGEFAVRIRLHIKSKGNLRNVSVSDKVPSFLKVYKNFGAILPDIIDEKRGSLTWKLGDLFSGEERIFSYILYSTVGVYGKVIFPEAIAVYEKGTKVLETLSNKIFFLSEQLKG